MFSELFQTLNTSSGCQMLIIV